MISVYLLLDAMSSRLVSDGYLLIALFLRFFFPARFFLKNVRPLAHEFIPPMQGLLPSVH